MRAVAAAVLLLAAAADASAVAFDFNGTCPSTGKCPSSAGGEAGLPCCQVGTSYECCTGGEQCVPNVGCRCFEVRALQRKVCAPVAPDFDFNGTCPADGKCPSSAGGAAGLPCCQVGTSYECCTGGEQCVPNVGCRCFESAKADAADLRRAATARPGPGSAVRAASAKDVFRVINAALLKGDAAVRRCSEWTHEELTALTLRLLQHADAGLNDQYERRSDNRKLRGSWGNPLRTPNARDGLCAELIMIWTHHLPAQARKELAKAVVLPSMPAELDEKETDPVYRTQVSCASCHYTSAPVAATNASYPKWGGATQFKVEVNMTDVSDSPDHPSWRFNYFYNSDLRASRYEHLGQQHDEVCGKSRSGKPCTVIYGSNPHQYYLVNDDGCCIGPSYQNQGTVKTDWLATDTTFVGNSTVRGYNVSEWLKYGASDNHYYATADDRRLPVRYMEHKNGKLKQWDFDLSTYKAEPQPASLFAQPDGCTRKCL
eukprot:TRINITY_DN3099_c0_g1_i5.p1 TRINITY_DN3099_c0_g1~~TRINITY_DN3099_c0_g1_i5.p1  ORF type:complete len:486 (+),score=171.41 TRINITY_DN3099_c0_g1_i5:62-1519(+)